MDTNDERVWATITHLGIVASFIVPMGNIILPLILWLVFKEKSAYIEYHSKEALNFQLTMIIAAIIGGVLSFIFIGIPILIAVLVVDVVYSVIAAIKANQGEMYLYPVSWRMVK